jgi:hypothetical protein
MIIKVLYFYSMIKNIDNYNFMITAEAKHVGRKVITIFRFGVLCRHYFFLKI